MSKNWTPSQLNILNTRGKTMLVSASSGSGKTTVMINLIADMIAGGAKVSEFLVTTFTRAAAADMKEKLFNELHRRLDSSKAAQKHIMSQLAELDTADIGTLHKFCEDLIRKYYYAADCDPSFTIIQEPEARQKKRRAVMALIRNRAEAGDKSFDKLYDIFARYRKPDKLIALLERVYDFCRSLGDWERWLDEAATGQNKNAQAYIQKYYALGKKHFEKVTDRIAQKARDCFFPRAEEFALYIKEQVKSQDCCIPNELNYPRMPNKNTLDSRQLELLDLIDKLKKEFKRFCDDIKVMSEPIDPQSKELIKTLVSAVKEFGQNYSQLKRADYELDFADLEHFALKILQNADIKAEVQEQYKYVLVDEYQDINPVQEAIISQVARADNLFMVGDLKQSIYRFRLCDPDIFLAKYNAFNSGAVASAQAFELNDNFRSVKPILDFCNAIFARIMTEDLGGIDYRNHAMLKGEKAGDGLRVKINLVRYGGKKGDPAPSPTQVYSVKGHVFVENAFNPAYAEADFIANEIHRLITTCVLKDADGTPRRPTYSDIVILCRSLKGHTAMVAKRLAEYFPIKMPPQENLADAAEIKNLLDYIRVVDNLKNDIPLAGVLRGPFCDLTDGDLAKIRQSYPKEQYFYEATLKYAARNKDEIAQKINKLLNNIEKHRVFAQCHNSYDLLRQIIADYDFMTILFKKPDGQTMWDNVCAFMDAIAQGRYNCPLDQFADYIENGAAELKAPENQKTSECIRIMTIHASKGLEFPIVFVAGMGAKYVYDKDEVNLDKELYIGINNYDTETREIKNSGTRKAISKKSVHQSREDEMRILYVALTRAEQYLILSAAIKENYKAPDLDAYSLLRAKSPIDFILSVVARDPRYAHWFDMEETLDIPPCYELQISKESEVPPISKSEPNITAPPKELITYFTDGLKPLYKPLPVATKYTVTELASQNAPCDSFIPSQFSFEDEEGALPGLGGTELGNAYHYAMYYIDKNALTLDAVKAELERMVGDNLLTPEQAQSIAPEKILKCLSSEIWQIARSNKYYLEQPFMLYTPAREILGLNCEDKTLVQGVIDLLILTDDGAIIVDYKITKADRARLVNLYSNQINLYASAAQKILHKNFVEKYIYSFNLDELVKF